MSGKILSIRTKGKATSLVELTVICDGEKTKYTISEGTYRKIGCPLSGEIIDGDSFDTLSREDEERRALIKALSILAYADNSQKRLFSKLVNHGFSRDVARSTVEECIRLGYINEDGQLERFILKYCEELFGPKKIMAKLATRGYSPSNISNMIRTLEAQGKIDFTETKRRLLSEKLPSDASYEERLKLLFKYGYAK